MLKLDQQKSKLFPSGFQPSWGVKDDSFDVSRQFDRDYCYPFMLADENARVQDLLDEASFFTEQFWREVRRTVGDTVTLQTVGF